MRNKIDLIDLIIVLAVGLIGYGIYLIYLPLMFMFLGGCLLMLAVIMTRDKRE